MKKKILVGAIMSASVLMSTQVVAQEYFYRMPVGATSSLSDTGSGGTGSDTEGTGSGETTPEETNRWYVISSQNTQSSCSGSSIFQQGTIEFEDGSTMSGSDLLYPVTFQNDTCFIESYNGWVDYDLPHAPQEADTLFDSNECVAGFEFNEEPDGFGGTSTSCNYVGSAGSNTPDETNRWYSVVVNSQSECSDLSLNNQSIVEFENGSTMEGGDFYSQVTYQSDSCLIDKYTLGTLGSELVHAPQEATDLLNSDQCVSGYEYSLEPMWPGADQFESACIYSASEETSCQITSYNNTSSTASDKAIWDQFIYDNDLYTNNEGVETSCITWTSETDTNSQDTGVVNYSYGFTMNLDNCDKAVIENSFPYDTPYPANNLIGNISIKDSSNFYQLAYFPTFDFLGSIQSFGYDYGNITIEARTNDLSGLNNLEMYNGTFKVVDTGSNLSTIAQDSVLYNTSTIGSESKMWSDYDFHTFENNFGQCSTYDYVAPPS